MKNSRKKILILGDSITLGVSELLNGRPSRHVSPTYVDRLRARFPAHHFHVDAEILRGSAGLETRLAELLDGLRPDTVLLMLGGNDADLDWRRFILTNGRIIRNNVPLEAFAANLGELARMTADAGAKCVLSDIPSHDLAMRGRWLSEAAGRDVVAIIESCGGQAESDRRLAAYNQAVRDVAAQTGAGLAAWGEAIRSVPVAQRYGADFTHPGERSHHVIADVLSPLFAVGTAARPDNEMAEAC